MVVHHPLIGGGNLYCPHDGARCTENCSVSRECRRFIIEELFLDKPEAVNHPTHYGGDTVYETIKVCEAWGLDQDAFLFMVVKYVSRAGKKGDALEDLKKAEFYLKRKIERLEAEKAARSQGVEGSDVSRVDG